MKDVSSKFFVVGLILTVFVSLISAFGGLTLANLKLFDHFSNYSQISETQANVLIITADEQYLPTNSQVANSDSAASKLAYFSALEKLVKQLQSNNAKAIVFVSQAKHNQLPQFLNSENLYLASPSKVSISGARNAIGIKPIEAIPFYSENGMIRQYSENARETSLIALFNNTSGQSNELAPFEKRFMNTFIQPSQFPNLTFTQATQGNLVEELVNQKVVLIELEHNSYFNGFVVPGKSDTASFIELQGMLIESYYQGLDFKSLPVFLTVILLIVAFCLNFVLLQLLSARGIVLNLFITTATIYIASFALLYYFQLILPAIELEVILVLSLIYFLSTEREIEEKLVHQVTANINSRLAKRIKPDEFNESAQPWPKLHSLLNHHLMLRRSIFLEKSVGASHVKEIDAFNCSIDDIKERRRDFKREPYLSAVEKKLPIKMTSKDYFKDVQDFESQYIVALEFAGELLGFWAFTANHTELNDIEQFEVQVLIFAVELSGLLYQRTKFQVAQQQRRGLVSRLIGLEVAQQEFSKLNTSISAFERRHDILQEIFNGMSSAAVLFDLFGQLVVFNRAAEELASENEVSLYSLTAHDLLLTLTRQPLAKVKQTLRRVTTLGEEVGFQIAQESGASNYVLKVRAIKANDTESDLSLPFLVMGILFEFINVETIQDVIERKKALFTKYSYQINNNLSCISLLARRLNKQEEEKQAETIRLIDQSIIEANQMQKKVEQALFNSQSTEKIGQTFDIVPLLKRVIEKIKKKLAKDDIQVKINAPKIISLAFSRPEEFSLLAEDILQLLLTDSQQQDPIITIDIADQERAASERRELSIHFKNRGFGIPAAELNNIKRAVPSEISDNNFIGNILLRARQLQSFKVDCQIISEIGVGFEVIITLPIFETL